MAISKLPTSASLKQVMDKFEEISLQDFSSIDIITASELPSEGKEGQLCIVTNTTPSKIILDYTTPNLLESEIFVKYHVNNDYTSFISDNNKLKILFSIREIFQKINGDVVNVFGYVWINNNWVRTVPISLHLFEAGVGDNIGVTGGYNTYIQNKPTTNSGTSATIGSSSISLKTDSSNGSVTYAIIATKNSIDVTAYSKLYIDFKSSCSSENKAIEKFSVGLYSSNANNINFNSKYETTKTVSRTTIEIDISNLSGEKYFKALIHANDYASGIPSANIYNAWME